MRKISYKVKRIFYWVEIILYILLPVTAALVLLIRMINPSLFSTNIILEFILVIVAAIAVTEGLSRFVTWHEIKQKLDDLQSYDSPSRILLEAAQNSGVVGLSPRFNQAWTHDIVKEIIKAKTPISISGVGLPSLHRDDELKNAIIAHSEKYDVRVLLLDPLSEEADRRADIERPLGRRTIADIEDTIEWLKIQMSQNKRFRVHLYQLPPMLSLFILEHFLYVEPYHFGRPEGLTGCIGGHVPMLKIRNNPERDTHNTYEFFKEHFDYLWLTTKGGRISLNFKVVEYKEGNYLIVKNENEFDINMDNWEVSAHGVLSSFKFGDFTWKEKDNLKISFSKHSSDKADHHWDIDLSTQNAILTFSNSQGTTVSQMALVRSTDECE
jgi:hypothetical protein